VDRADGLKKEGYSYDCQQAKEEGLVMVLRLNDFEESWASFPFAPPRDMPK